MKSNKDVYTDFSKKLMSLELRDRRRSWLPLSFKSSNSIVDFWNSLSRRKKISLVKDSRWNHYPLASYTPSSKKKYGSVILKLVSKVVENPDDQLILKKHSVGVFAIHMIDISNSATRQFMAKRLKASKDLRLRTRSVRILPINAIGCFLEDSAYSVRNHTINRLGFDNCYHKFIPDGSNRPAMKNMWWQSHLQAKAIKSADISEVEGLFGILSDDAPSDKLSRHSIEALLRKIPREDIVFYLQNSEVSDQARKIISQKLK